MSKRLLIDATAMDDPAAAQACCPFEALEPVDGRLCASAACRFCGVCVKRAPQWFSWLEEAEPPPPPVEDWRGLLVAIECTGGRIAPVSLELLGKGRELADQLAQPLIAMVAGHDLERQVEALRHHGLDELDVYEHQDLADFRIEPHAACLMDCIARRRPGIVLVGGTPLGRSLAPRVAARCRTGLTADCTELAVQEDGLLDQIRPAFGGNIMAHIGTPRHRPQFATVRPGIFERPRAHAVAGGIVCRLSPEPAWCASRIDCLELRAKPQVPGIDEAKRIVVAGRGIRRQADLALVHRLAALLDAQVAATRPLIEAGWADPRCQIGLSGRTVRPELLIACGVSGAIQFVAGMRAAQTVVAINSDPGAPIFGLAHIAIEGDCYQVIPALIERLAAGSAALEELVA